MVWTEIIPQIYVLTAQRGRLACRLESAGSRSSDQGYPGCIHHTQSTDDLRVLYSLQSSFGQRKSNPHYRAAPAWSPETVKFRLVHKKTTQNDLGEFPVWSAIELKQKKGKSSISNIFKHHSGRILQLLLLLGLLELLMWFAKCWSCTAIESPHWHEQTGLVDSSILLTGTITCVDLVIRVDVLKSSKKTQFSW